VKQLRLPTTPRFDEYGLHASDCECVRCSAGYRPSMAERWAAKMAHERALDAERAREVKAAGEARKIEAAARVTARLERDSKAVAERLREERALRARCRPLTAEEIAELRQENGLRPPRKGKL
jgi:hypothetical protein